MLLKCWQDNQLRESPEAELFSDKKIFLFELLPLRVFTEFMILVDSQREKLEV